MTGVVVGLVVSGGIGAGWLAANTVVSPAQRAAAASPPPARDVVVEVQRGTLSETFTAQAVVGDARQTTVALMLGSEPSSVVTSTGVAPGQPVAAGQVVVEVSGRPVFALPGAFPFYRDLAQGDVGPDVEQLQRGLRSAGYAVGVDGEFGARTAAAVVSMVVRAGYDRSLVVSSVPAEGPAGSASGAATAEGADAPAGTGPAATPAPAAEPAGGPGATRELVSLSRSDLLVVPALPQVLSASPGVGTVLTAGDATVVLSDGSLSVTSSVPAGTAVRIPVGSPVTLTGDGVTVPAVTGAPAGDATAPEMTLPYVVDPAALPPDARGKELLATITAQVVAEDSLIVPTRSVITHATRAGVLLADPDGSTTEVPVELLGELAGQSAVRPLEPDALETGDSVVVR